jgi:hypothetical protein
MLNQSIWWGGIAVEILLLVRGVRGQLLFRYPVFYAYVSFVLTQSLLRFFIYQWHRDVYRDVYWTTEFLGVLIGCGIVFEIYRVGLSAYPGTAQMARKVLSIVFVMAVAGALAEASQDSRWWVEATSRDIEQTLRAVQALSLAALVALFLFYSIPFGRNLRGMLLGYGLFISASVISLTFTSSGVNKIRDFWAYLNPASYDLALGFWITHLWSYCAVPETHRAVRLEQEYQRIAAGTHRRLQRARGYLAKTVRS